MKKIISFISVLFICFTIIADTYIITDIVGANGSKGRAKGRGGALTIGQTISDNDTVKVENGNIIILDNDKEINRSGKVKEVVEKRKVKN